MKYYLTLAAALERSGKYKQAAANYLEGLKLKPDSALAHYRRAVVLVRMGSIQKALMHYREALRGESPKETVGIEEKRFKEAMADYCKKMEDHLRTEDAEGHHNLAVAQEWRGNLKAAASHYAQALRIRPKDAELHNNLGVVLARLGRFKAAVDHFTNALRIRPGYPDAEKNLRHARDILAEPGESPGD